MGLLFSVCRNVDWWLDLTVLRSLILMWMGVSLGQPEMGENLMTEKLIRLFFNIFSFIFRIQNSLQTVVCCDRY